MFEFLYTFLPVFFTSSSPVDLEKRFPETQAKEQDDDILIVIADNDEDAPSPNSEKQPLLKQVEVQTQPQEQQPQQPQALQNQPTTTVIVPVSHKIPNRRFFRRERIRHKLQEMKMQSKDIPRKIDYTYGANRINQPKKRETVDQLKKKL